MQTQIADRLGRSKSTISRTIGGSRFRRQRSTPGFAPRRPTESTGSVICGVWAESGRSGKNVGGCRPA
jgi:hypothetical protein